MHENRETSEMPATKVSRRTAGEGSGHTARTPSESAGGPCSLARNPLPWDSLSNLHSDHYLYALRQQVLRAPQTTFDEAVDGHRRTLDDAETTLRYLGREAFGANSAISAQCWMSIEPRSNCSLVFVAQFCADSGATSDARFCKAQFET
jgi:hypothetical protein